MDGTKASTGHDWPRPSPEDLASFSHTQHRNIGCTVDSSKANVPIQRINWETFSLKESLSFLEQTGDLPAVETFISVLQRCRKQQDLEPARHLHALLCDFGLGTHRILGNYLVPLFVECESRMDAERAFHGLDNQNECSWTSLIQGYVDAGDFTHAFDLFQKMQESGVQPTGHTYVALLKAAARLRCIKRGRYIYAEICKEGLESQTIVGTALLIMCIKCGFLTEAQEVFNSLSSRTIISWNAMISAYVEQGDCEEVMKCLDQMQEEGVPPNDVTLICCLKVCGNTGDLERGRETHIEISNKGFETGPFVGNSLVDMYAKCGSFVEAWGVFDVQPNHTVVPWTALISGYAEQRLGEEALECFESMHSENIPPDDITYACGLKACMSIGAIDRGRELHSEIIKKGHEGDLFLGNILVDMYARDGSFTDAHKVFDGLVVPDLVSWNTFIAGFAQHGLGEDGLKCFTKMQLTGLSPDVGTFISSLKACCSIGSIDRAQEIHDQVAKVRLEKNPLIQNALVDVYAKCGSIVDAQFIFQTLPSPDIHSWSSLMAGYADHGFELEALNCLEEMQAAGVFPNDVTFVCSLNACGSRGAQDMGFKVHAEILKEGFEDDGFVGESVVDMYCKCGSLVEAQEVFDDLPVHNVVSWTALMAGYAEHGPYEEALRCLELMQSEGVPQNAVTYICVLKACGSMGSTVHKGQEIHDEIVKKGFENNCLLSNTLANLYAKCGRLAEARSVFDKLPVQGTVSWNSLIAGYVEHNVAAVEALNSLELMQAQGVVPDPVTYIWALKACTRKRSLNKGVDLHIELAKRGYEKDPLVGSTLVDLYAKCTSFEEAQGVFDSLSEHDVVAWNMLIAGYADSGLSGKVLDCMRQMQLEGVSPNAFTYAYGLKACNNIEDLDWGRTLHSEVIQRGLEGNSFVSTTLVIMYARCAILGEAQEVFGKLRYRGTCSWNALISGFIGNGLSEEALNHFDQMEQEGAPLNTISFVCGLKACEKVGALGRGRELHSLVIKLGLETDVFVANTLVAMYAKGGSLEEAQDVFGKRTNQDEVSWNALLTGYAEHECAEALNCMKQMHSESASQNGVTFVCILKACSSVGAVHTGQELHSEIVKRGSEIDLSVGNGLVDMYGKCLWFTEALAVFNELCDREISSWNTLLAVYGTHGFLEESVECLAQMQLEGVSPNNVTYVSILQLCGGVGEGDVGRTVHSEIVKKGLERDSFVGNTLVDMYAKCDSLREAKAVLETLPFQDVVTWSALISGYCECGPMGEALRCLERMQVEGVSPNVATWNIVILGCSEHKRTEMAFNSFSKMQEQGVLPNNLTFMSALKACSKSTALVTGKRIHSQISRYSGLQPFEVAMAKTTLIHMYGKCGSMADAREVFDAMPLKALATWNALLAGYVHQRDKEHVIQVFERMEDLGIHPDEITLDGVLSVCCQGGLLEKDLKRLELMFSKYGICLTIKNHRCMLEVLGCAGQKNGNALSMLRACCSQTLPPVRGTAQV